MGVPPQEGLTTQAKLVKCIDADTYVVEIVRRFNIRLLDPSNYNNTKWGAEEKNTEAGKKAIAKATEFLKDVENVTVFIPSNNPLNLMDISTFNRILGEIWVGDVNLGEWLESQGLAHKQQHLKENQ